MKRTHLRFITVLVALSLVISMLTVPASALSWDNVSETRYASRYQTSQYASGKFYKNLTQIPLTGDGARDVVAVAASQVGYIEGDNAAGYSGEVGGSTNYTEYGCFLGLNGGSGHAWCAAFCAWSFYAAEVTDVLGSQYDTDSGNIWADAYVPYWSEYLIEQGRYKAAYQFRNSYSDLYDASYVPQPGDLVFFYTASGDYPGWEGHIGLVAYSDGTYVYTLEGNTSSQNGVESEGGGMFFKKYSLTGSSLVGFGVMPYETVDGLPEIDYTGANPTPGLYVTPSGSVSVYQSINDSSASWTLPMSSVFEVTEIAQSTSGRTMLYSKCEINGSTVHGWIPLGSDANGYTKTLQVYSSGEAYVDPNDVDRDGIPDSYGVTVEDGIYIFDNAYGYEFTIDDVDGTIDGEDATIITSASAYSSCNPNWAISVQLRPTDVANEYQVVKVVETPGSASAANITLEDGDIIMVVHSAASYPGAYANWMSKVAALALKEGDIVDVASDNTTVTVLSAGESAEPDETEPVETEPVETEPVETKPVADVPDYGGLIPGAGVPGTLANPVTHLAMGCDLSFYNVDDTDYRDYITNDDSGADYSLLDFQAMKDSGCDFVILRMGASDTSGYYYDPHFVTMYNMAREVGLDLGVYFYSYAMSQSEAIAEAEYVIDVIEDYGMYFEYPIYIDIEEADQLALGSEAISAIAEAWCETMYDNGYFPGIYGGYNLFDLLSTEIQEGYDLWLAWLYYSDGTIAAPETDNISDDAGLWQFTFTGQDRFDGIGLDMLDVNVAYKDYAAIMEAYGYNNVPTSTQPDPIEPSEPDETEPVETEPVETEPEEVDPADVPDYGGAIPGAGMQGYTNNLYYGIDISYHNVNDQSYHNYETNDDSGADYSLLDFEALKASGCDYVIIRLGSEDSTGKFIDPHFKTMYNLAREADLDIGLYFYSYALTYDEAVEDAQFCLDYLEQQDMYFEYPLYIDLEEDDQLALGQSGLDSLVYGWCETMVDAGYFPAVYGNYNFYDTMGSQVKQDYDYWLAWYGGYTPDTNNVSSEVAMWQYSSSGHGEYDGIGLEFMDVNVSYKDYPAIITAGGYNNVDGTNDDSDSNTGDNGNTGNTGDSTDSEVDIPDSYGATVDEDGMYTFENAYGYVFEIDDVNGTIDGEDATLITTASAYSSCNPNWAISVQLRPTGAANEYQVVKVVETPGSASAADITLQTGDMIMVVHSAESCPGTYDNWMSKVAALALKTGDIVNVASDNTTVTVVSSGEFIDPDADGDGIPDSYGVSVDEDGIYSFDNAYGYVFSIDDVNGTIDGEDTTLIVSASYYSSCNPNWAISVQLRPTDTTNEYEVVKVVETPGSASAAGITTESGDVILVVHSAASYPGDYENWMSKVAAVALKEGDIVEIASDNTTATVLSAGETEEPVIPEETEPEETEPVETEPVETEPEETEPEETEPVETEPVETEPADPDADGDGIPDSYGVSVDDGIYSFDNAYGYVFDIDDVNGTIEGEDATIITSSSYYSSCNPNWAISVQLRPTGNTNEYQVVKVVETPGSASAAGISLSSGDVIMVVHSAASYPGDYENWMSKVAAIALKKGDIVEIASDNSTVTVISEGVLEETEEPEVTEPVTGDLQEAGIPGSAGNIAYGCDVSFYNVNDTSYANYTTYDDSAADYSLLDFERMKADGCDFVILRMGSEDSSGRYTDPHFFTMYDMAREAGMDIGLYYYSYAMTYDEAAEDANYVIDVIEDNGMYFEYPIYIDIEETDQLALSQSEMSDLCYGWCETMVDAGYFPGIYGSYKLYDGVSSDVRNTYDFWVAWVSSATEASAYNPSTHNISNECAMWQYSWYGYEYDGVGLDMLDVNVAYKDYPAIMAKYGYNNY